MPLYGYGQQQHRLPRRTRHHACASETNYRIWMRDIDINPGQALGQCLRRPDFFLAMSWSMPTANAEGPCRSEGPERTRLTEAIPDDNFRLRSSTSALAVGMRRKDVDAHGHALSARPVPT